MSTTAVATARVDVAQRRLILVGLAAGALSGAALRSPVVVIGLLFLAIVAVLVIRWPQPAMVLLFFLLPFQTFITDALTFRANLQPQPFTLWKDFLIGALLLRAVYMRIRTAGFGIPRSAGDQLILGYVLWLAAVAALSPELQPAGYGLALEAEGPLLLLAVIALRPSRRVMMWCLIAMLAAAVIMSVAGIWEQGVHEALPKWFGHDPRTEVDYHTDSGYRSGSLFGDPLVFGTYMACVVPLAFAAVALAARRWRMSAAAVTGVCIGGMVVTYTRSAYLGGGFGVLIFLVLAIRNPRMRTSAVGLFLVLAASAAGIAAVSGDDRILHAGGQQAHFAYISRDLTIISQHPLGYGLGTTDLIGRRFNVDLARTPTESAYLARGVEQGVIGMLFYISVLLLLTLRVWSAYRRASRAGDERLRLFAAGALGAIAAAIAAGLFLPVRDLSINVIFWGFGALVVSAAGSIRVEDPSVDSRRLRSRLGGADRSELT